MKPLYAFTIFGLLTIAIPAQAHFIWVTIEPNGRIASLELADSPGNGIAPILYTLKDSFKTVGLENLIDSKDHRLMKATITDPKKPIGISAQYGVFQNALVHWSAKGATSLTQAKTSTGLASDISIIKKGNTWIVTVTFGGKPSVGADVEVYSTGLPNITAKTDLAGNVRLKTLRGLTQIGAMIHQPTPGSFKGTSYKEKLEVSSLVLRV